MPTGVDSDGATARPNPSRPFRPVSSRAILDSLRDQVCAFDRNCRCTFVGRYASGLLDIPSSELVGRRWSELEALKKVAGPIEREVEEVMKTGVPLVNSALSPFDSDLPVDYVISPIFGRSGGVEGAVLLARDKRSRVRIESGLPQGLARGGLEGGARYRAILDSLCDRVYAFDRDCRYVFAGEYACRHAGLKLSEMLDKHWSELGFPEELMRPIESSVKEVFASGLPAVDSAEYEWMGKYLAIDYTISPVVAEDGVVESVVVLVRETVSEEDRDRELSAYRRASGAGEREGAVRLGVGDSIQSLDNWVAEQRMAKEATSLRRALLRSISHDYRGPLTVIIASLQELAEHGGELSPALSKSMARTGLSQAQRLERFLDNLIYAAEIDAARLVPTIEEEDGNEIVADVLERSRGETTGRRVVWEPSPGGLPVHVDRTLIVQALLNVVGNAANYSPEGSTITVTALPRDGGVVFQVKDEGPGMPAHFREGRELDYGTGPDKRTAKRGLGLEITREICKAHGGELVITDGERGGTIVSVVLPRANQ